jgi:hypothetical protein
MTFAKFGAATDLVVAAVVILLIGYIFFQKSDLDIQFSAPLRGVVFELGNQSAVGYSITKVGGMQKLVNEQKWFKEFPGIAYNSDLIIKDSMGVTLYAWKGGRASIVFEEVRLRGELPYQELVSLIEKESAPMKFGLEHITSFLEGH